MTLITTLAMFTALAAQDTDPMTKVISLESRAASIQTIVQKLEDLSGVKLKVEETLRSDILFVQVDDVTVQQVMDKIAWTTYAKWVKGDDGVLRLMPDVNALKVIKDARYAKRLAEVREALKQKISGKGDMVTTMPFAGPEAGAAPDEPTEAPAPPEQAEKVDKNVPQPPPAPMPPEPELLRELLKQVRPEVLAGMIAPARVVYATPNTQMQYPLSGLGPAMQRWFALNNERAAWDAKQPKEENPEMDNMPEWIKMFSEFGKQEDRKVLQEVPAKVSLSFTMEDGMFQTMMGRGISIELRVYDRTGKIIGQGGDYLNVSMGSDRQRMIEDMMAERTGKKPEKKEEPPLDIPNGKLEVEPISADFDKLATFGDTESFLSYQPTPELLERMQRPDLYDPLSFKISDYLKSTAKVTKLDVIAHLSDQATSASNFFGNKSMPDVHAYYRALQSDTGQELKKDGGWLELRPKNPDLIRKSRFDRSSLAKLIASVKDKELPSLDDMADYAAVNEPPSENPLVSSYIFYFTPNLFDSMPGMQGTWGVLRLYGRLTISQRNSLAQGGKIPIGSLDNFQKDAARRLLFDSKPRLMTAESEATRQKMEKENPMMFIASAFGDSGMFGSKDYANEPTEVMPNGLPADGFLEASVKEEEMAVMVSDDTAKARKLGAFGADELALIIFFMEEMNMPGMPSFKHFRPGDRKLVDLTVRVSPNAFLREKLVHNRMQKDTKTVQLEGLPTGLRTRIQDRIAMIKKQGGMDWMRGGRGNSGREP